METLQDTDTALKVSLNHDSENSQSFVTEPDGELIQPDYAVTSGQHKVNKCYLLMLCFFSCIGGLLFGYDTGVIAGANLYIDESFQNVTDFEKELIVSLTILGAAIGSLFGGPMADRFGRKPTIFIADVCFTTGCLVMAFSPSVNILILGRFIVGLGVGSAAIVVPVYLAEVAPASVRGILVSLNAACITTGQFLALLICLGLGNRWRWMLGLAGVPSFLQGVGILFLIESPRWLFKVGQNQKGKDAIKCLYLGDEATLEPIIKEQQGEAGRVRKYENISNWSLIKQLFGQYYPCLVVGCGIQMFQQLSGINTAMYYGPEIMRQAGFGSDSHKSATLISALPLAGMNSIGTIISIAFIDSCGRRWIMLRSLPVLALSMTVAGIGMGLRNHTNEDDELLQVIGKWCAACGLSFYTMSFAIGFCSTPWTINSEIYPLHLRGLGNSLSTTTNWVSNFGVALVFLTLMKHIPYGDIIGFEIFSVMCILAFFFVYFKIPETKGLKLDDVISLFVKDHNQGESLINDQDKQVIIIR